MKNNRPILPTTPENIPSRSKEMFKEHSRKYRNSDCALKKSFMFWGNIKKKKNWWTTKWTTFQMAKLDLQVLYFSLVTVQNRMWNENVTILEKFCICQWFKVMKRLNLATWQILLLLEYSGLVNWNLRQFIFNAIIPGYMEK